VRGTPKRFVQPGDVVRMEISFSEVAMYMHVAGEVMNVRFQSPYGYPNAQLLLEDGRPFSAPITPGEAGFYCEDGRYYCYPVEDGGRL
jgi:hypothetical protein